MALLLLLLPASHSPASPSTHLSAAQHSPHQLPHSLRALSTPGLFPWPVLSASPPIDFPAAAAAAAAVSTALVRGGRRTWGCFSRPAAPDSVGVEAAVAGTTREAGDSRTRLLAQNIPWTCTAEDIRGLFDKHGAVVNVELSMYSRTRNRGLAFITMASEEEALSALNNLNSYQLDGRLIKVEFARALKNKSSTPTPEPVTRHDVFVGNLNWRVRSRNLRELFTSTHPNLMSAEVIFQSNPRRSAGYGFVSFGSKEEAEAAVSAFNGKKLMGRAIRLVFGKEQSAESGVDPNESGEFEEKSS